MIFLVRVGVQTLELMSFLVAVGAEEKIVTVLTHPTLFQNLSLAVETFVFFAVLDLRLEDDLQLMIGLVSTHETTEGG